MSFSLRLDESEAHGLRRLAKKAVRAMRRALNQPKPSAQRRIHDARKSLKKLRVIAGLIRADGGRHVRRSERRLKRVNKILSRFRDAETTLEILGKLEKTRPRALGRSALT